MSKFNKSFINRTIFALTLGLIIILIYRGFNIDTDNYKKIIITTDFSFLDISEKAGISFTHEMINFPPKLEKVSPYLRGQSSSVSIVDINNDEYPDIYLTTSTFQKPNKLYVNNKDGTFSDKASDYEIAHLNSKSFTFRSLFFDCDNDGDQDLFLLTNSCPRLFMNDSQKKVFTESQLAQLPQDHCMPVVAANVWDYDRDGYLDIIYSPLGGVNFLRRGALPNSFVSADNGGVTVVLKNSGQCSFSPVEIMKRQKDFLYTNAIGIGDFKGNNKQDIWFATDFHHDEVYLEESDGYKEKSHLIEPTMAKTGMAAESVYLGSDNIPHVFVSHVYRKGYYPHGNGFYQFKEKSFKNYAIDMNVDQCGWAWGAKFFDVNNDSFKDLYVANGFFTGESKDRTKDFSFPMAVINSSSSYLIKDSSYWPSMKDKNLSGFDQDCLFINNKNNYFQNVKNNDSVQIDNEKLNGRAVATLDFDKNGSVDLLVSNQMNKVYLYQNQQKNNHSWVAFKLEGRMTNRDAIGSKMKITYQDNNNQIYSQTEELRPFNGYVSQSENMIHFGLGSYQGSVSAEIIWPNGLKQVINNLEINKYHRIIEDVPKK